MRIGLLTLQQAATGNYATGIRIQSYLENAGYQVLPINVDSWPIDKPLPVDVAIGVHAYNSGKYLCRQSFPYAIIFSGTDANAPQKHWESIIETAAHQASIIITYNNDTAKKVLGTYADIQEKLLVIPKGVHTHPSKFSLKNHLDLSNDDRIFLLPAGLRGIKDPLYLVEEFQKWHKEDGSIFLVIIGAVRDKEYADTLSMIAMQHEGIVVMEPLQQPDLWSAMREATAVLNTSKSESNPNTILEAMHVGTPVIVRDIPGNTSLVQHKKTGLVFNSPEQFRTLATALIQDASQGNTLANTAQKYVQIHHSLVQEKELYLKVVSYLAQISGQ